MERLKLKLHFSFYVASAIYLLLGQFVTFLCYFAAMILHEASHFWVAKRLFYRCRQMEISCFGAVLYGDFDCASKRDLVLIALAGPTCNFALALACVSLWWIAPQSYYFTCDFVWANVGMAAVNLMPVYPLDGGKVVCGLLQSKLSKQTSQILVKKAAVILAILLLLVFVIALLYNQFLPSLCLFSVFIFCASTSKGKTAYQRLSYLQNYTKRMVKGVEKKTLVFDADATVGSVAKRMIGGSLYDVEVWRKGKLVKRYSFYQLDQILKTANPNDKLLSVVEQR